MQRIWRKSKKLFRRRRSASPPPSSAPSTATAHPSNPENANGRSISTTPLPSPAAASAAETSVQPTTDLRIPEGHQPPAISQTPSPVPPAELAPEPPTIQSTDAPVPVLSKSEELWNAAYDSLEAENKELVEAYMKCLEAVLGANPGVAPDTDILAELHDPTKRQIHMRRLVKEGQARIARASTITSRIGDVAGFVLSVKGILDLAVQSVPQAALPWAGVCVGLQMLQNPAQATSSNLAGIAHVISRMEWYCALTEHLLNKDNIATGEDFQKVLCQLEHSIVRLYKALLQYQMKSVCSYYRNQGVVFLRNMFNLDDWDGDLKAVTDAETVVQNDTAQFFQEQTKMSLREIVKHAEGMERLLGDIHQDIRDFILSQKDVLREENEAACRRDLRVVDPQDDMERIEKNKDELLDNAYNWIFLTQEYAELTNWGDTGSGHPPRRLLWIKGHAGTGKTMLMIGLIRQLSNRSAALSPGISFFFCQDTDAALNTATAVLRSLIWLLLLQQPGLMSHLLQKYKESGAKLFTDNNAFIALSKAFQNMLRDPQLSPVYLAVDALDECREGRSDLIELILTSLTLSPKVKWLISGRPEVDLRAALKGRDPASLLDASSVLVELDTQRLERPVNAFINHKLSMLKPEDGYNDNILKQVAEEVRERAENTFLWVALAFKVLETVNGWYAVERIKEMPPKLSELYDHMMTRIEKQDHIKPEDCKTVLVLMFAAFRPLSILELSALTGMPESTTKKAIEKCGSFVTITDGTVNLVHQSAKDYLEKNLNRLQLVDPDQAHCEILRRSIDAMSARLRRNMYNLEPDSRLWNIRPPDPDPLAPIRYSCVFWADHLCSLNNDDPRFLRELMDDGKTSEFLKEHLIHWLKSSYLMCQVHHTLRSIRKILRAAQLKPGIDLRLLKLLNDAERIFYYYSPTPLCPWSGLAGPSQAIIQEKPCP